MSCFASQNNTISYYQTGRHLQICDVGVHLFGGDMIKTKQSSEIVVDADPNADRTELHVGVTSTRRVKRKLNLGRFATVHSHRNFMFLAPIKKPSN
jgi:hypothetical protein